MNTSNNKGPLAGIKVIEMSTVVFGPYGAQILADLGAEVIKVETDSGDVMRLPGNTPVKGMGPIYMALNRNKQSIKLELKNPAALGAMRILLADADVFYTNVRMGGLERLGLSYELVKEINPNILFVHCTGFLLHYCGNCRSRYHQSYLGRWFMCANTKPGSVEVTSGRP